MMRYPRRQVEVHHIRKLGNLVGAGDIRRTDGRKRGLRFSYSRRRIRGVLLLLFVLVAPVLFIVAQHQWKLGQKAPASGTVEVSHVFLIAMEGRGYHQIIGNPQAPYTNSLARAYGLAVQYSALSQRDLPNYLQLVAGSNFGITTNCSACFVSGNSLAHEIEGAGETWKAYMESMPSHCALHNAGGYLLYQNPFAYFRNARSSCDRYDVPYTQFHIDLAAGHLPTFVWIAPNSMDDMGNGTIQQGDICFPGRSLQSCAPRPFGTTVSCFSPGMKPTRHRRATRSQRS